MKTRDITGTPVEHPDKLAGPCTCDHQRGTGRTTNLWAECVEFAKANPDDLVMWFGPDIRAMMTPRPKNIRMYPGSLYHSHPHYHLGVERHHVFLDHTV